MDRILPVALVITGALLVLGSIVAPAPTPALTEIMAWMGVVLIVFGSVVYALYVVSEMSQEAQDYVKEMAPYWFRAIGLLSVFFTLMYLAFVFHLATSSDEVKADLASSEARLEILQRRVERIQRAVAEADKAIPLPKGEGKKPERDVMIVFQAPPELLRAEQELENTKKNILVLKHRLESLQKNDHQSNALFALRALSLGGIGALVTLLSRRTIGGSTTVSESDFFRAPRYWTLLLTHTILGGLIALIAFALFFTRQITIFRPEETGLASGGTPDFWRVALLCIVAGAFAEKIYDALSSRVDKYMQSSKTKVPKSASDK